jgi:hypothetical protein
MILLSCDDGRYELSDVQWERIEGLLRGRVKDPHSHRRLYSKHHLYRSPRCRRGQERIQLPTTVWAEGVAVVGVCVQARYLWAGMLN